MNPLGIDYCLDYLCYISVALDKWAAKQDDNVELTYPDESDAGTLTLEEVERRYRHNEYIPWPDFERWAWRRVYGE